MDCEAVQQIALALDILFQLHPARCRISPLVVEESLKQQLQEAELKIIYARVFHQLGVAQRSDLLLDRRRLNASHSSG
jgi:hypothetical protein